MSENYTKQFKDHRCCVLIPTYNNEKTVERVISGVLEYCKDVYVINDGSTDSTAHILERYKDYINILTQPKNQGKGKAIRRGFKQAIKDGYKYAVTIDSDGQHFPEDLPKFLKESQENKGAVIMGSRNMDQEGVPGKSSFGNKFSNFWFYVETGIKLPDTQTGYRLYPLEPIKKKKFFTTKFEFEIEVIVKLAWAGVPFKSIPIKVLYDPDERVSHFRPFRDFTRISFLNTYLVTLTIIWHLHIRLIRKITRKGLWNLFKEEWRNNNESNLRKATAVGFGFFMGIIPIWGFQMLVAGVIAKLLRLNVIITLVASNISIPPMIPLIIFLSYWLGGMVLHNSIELTWNSGLTLEDVYLNLKQYVIGSVILAILAGILMFITALITLSAFRKKTGR